MWVIEGMESKRRMGNTDTSETLCEYLTGLYTIRKLFSSKFNCV
jgi:hypothetical protein